MSQAFWSSPDGPRGWVAELLDVQDAHIERSLRRERRDDGEHHGQPNRVS
jgi:hypothetical protein